MDIVSSAAAKPKLLDQVREAIRLRHYSRRTEVPTILASLDVVMSLIVALLYGGGLRLHECLELLVKALDLARNQLVVRRGKGSKDRVVPLPALVRPAL